MNVSEIISFLRTEIDESFCKAIFLGGSKPGILEKGEDLDFFVIIEDSKIKESLDKLKEVCLKLKELDPELEYSFLRGPLKLENKKLLQFIIYLYGDQEIEKYSFVYFRNEHKAVLKSLVTNSEKIKGQDISELLEGVNLEEKGPSSIQKKSLIPKYKRLIEDNEVEYKEWKKKEGEWVCEPTQIKTETGSFTYNYLKKYYEKHI